VIEEQRRDISAVEQVVQVSGQLLQLAYFRLQLKKLRLTSS
jgi:hypothetical protein